MRVAFVLPSLANRGPAIVTQGIVNSLFDKVTRIDVYYFDNVIELDFRAETRRIHFFEKFDFGNYDIIHSHGIRPDGYVWLNRKRIPGKCVSTMHNYIKEDLRFKYGKLISFVFSRVWFRLVAQHDKIVTLSHHMMEYYLPLLGNRNFTYIYNGRNEVCLPEPVDEGDHERIATLKRDFRIIGAACIVTKRKGLEHIVKYLTRNQDYALLVIGSGPEKENLIKLTKDLGVLSRCLFLGYRKKATRYFKYFDIYAMPSRSEGFPLALIEAASFKKPVICSSIGVFREIFNEDEVAFFELDVLDSFSAAIKTLDKEPEKFSSNIYKKYKMRYTAEIMAENYLELYKSLLNSE